MSAKLILYSTTQCSLCEQALTWLLSQDGLRGIQLETVDIALDDALFEQYAEQIPVLQIGAEILRWPFDEARLMALTSAQPPTQV